MNSFRIATFVADITPPIGSPLCGGMITPAQSIGSPLQALGVVLLGDTKPIILCALDWCELRGPDQLRWRKELAAAAGTSADRVAVQCVHQHDAPLVDSTADALVRNGGMGPTIDAAWCESALDRVAESVRAAMDRTEPLTHFAYGSARVDRIASNRRVMGEDGKVRAVRYSACRDAAIREAPEGTIDPLLKMVSLCNNERKVAVLYYYATHPMSRYGEGNVSRDFAGDARSRMAAADGAVHIYFNGCAGNITVGKYNDGTPEAQRGLTERLAQAMTLAQDQSQRVRLRRMSWNTRDIRLVPDSQCLDENAMMNQINDIRINESERYHRALARSFVRHNSELPVVLSCLELEQHVQILHLPGEPFVEYQLWAQSQNPHRMVAVAGYGDGSTGYIPLKRSFLEGGYEPTCALASPDTETLLKQEMAILMQSEGAKTVNAG